jgi:uncharacterized membrane protein
VFRVRQRIKGSLWALPLIGGFVGVGLAQIILAIDGAITFPAGWRYSASTASSVLAAIIGAMISLLGFVVTVTVLVVQQATGDLSPRYMRLWYRDRLQKVVLACFVGTFTYSYALLRHIGGESVPVLGVTLAGIAVGVSLVLLLLYVNRFTHNLRPVAVAASVAAAGQEVLAHYGSPLIAGRLVPDVDTGRLGEPSLLVRTPRRGAIQAVAGKRLLTVAVQHDCLLVLAHPVGDFLPAETVVLEVYGTSTPDPRVLAGLVALDTERTLDQDPAFALRILVDIAIRALSPAVNDPTTAVQVLDYLEDLLQSIAATPLRSMHTVGDAQGRPRLMVPGRTWDEFIALGFTEIRQYGATSPQVCRRLRAALEGLRANAGGERQKAIAAEMARLDASVDRNFADPEARAFARESDRQGIGGLPSEPRATVTPSPDRTVGVALPRPTEPSPQQHDVRH